MEDDQSVSSSDQESISSESSNDDKNLRKRSRKTNNDKTIQGGKKLRWKGAIVSGGFVEVVDSALNGVLPIVMSLPEADVLDEDEKENLISCIDIFAKNMKEFLATDAMLPKFGSRLTLETPIMKNQVELRIKSVLSQIEEVSKEVTRQTALFQEHERKQNQLQETLSNLDTLLKQAEAKTQHPLLTTVPTSRNPPETLLPEHLRTPSDQKTKTNPHKMFFNELEAIRTA